MLVQIAGWSSVMPPGRYRAILRTVSVNWSSVAPGRRLSAIRVPSSMTVLLGRDGAVRDTVLVATPATPTGDTAWRHDRGPCRQYGTAGPPAAFMPDRRVKVRCRPGPALGVQSAGQPSGGWSTAHTNPPAVSNSRQKRPRHRDRSGGRNIFTVADRNRSGPEGARVETCGGEAALHDCRDFPGAAPVSDLPRRAVTRTAKLATLPVGLAGRTALGLGKRLGGRPAERVAQEIQQRTAEQIFKVLGELKGGALKLGQALSIFEAALPPELAGPYRATLTRLQESAPPLPAR